MGVYSSGRLAFAEGYASEVEIPEPNTSYYGHDGANRILAEAAVNDLAMFEAIIGNDIQQAYVENAINEGADLGTELEALQEAAAGGMFSRLKEFIKKIWEKITGLILSFVRKVQGAVTSDNKKLVEKFNKQIMTNSTKLKKMKFKWSKLTPAGSNGFKYEGDNKLDKGAVEKRCADKVNSIFAAGFNVASGVTGNGFDPNTLIAQYTALNTELDKEEWEDNQLGGFIGTSTTVSDFAKDAHKYFFEDEDTLDGEFSKYVDNIKKTLNDSKTTIKGVEDDKKAIDKYFSETTNKLDKLTSAYLKAKKFTKAGATADDDAEDIVTTSFTGDKAKDDGVEISFETAMARGAAALHKFYSSYQGVVTKALNAKMAAINFHIKQCRRVWTQAAAFSERPLKEEALLFDAIGEAADFDTDQLFCY